MPDPPAVEAGFNGALSLWRSGRPREALAAAAVAARSTPSVEGLYLVAALHAALQEHAAAAHYLRRVTLLKPDEAAAHRRLAESEIHAGNMPAAVDSLRRVVELEPGNAGARRNLGVLLEQAGDLQAAAECHRAALAVDDADPVTHFNLGNVLLHSGDRLGAVACYRTAAARRPDFAAAWCNCAGVLLSLKRTAEAAECAGKAVALDDRMPEAWHVRAVVLKESGRLEEALGASDRAIALRPDYAQAVHVRGGILRALGDRHGAVAAFRHALRLDPHLEEARLSAVMAEIPIVPSTASEVADSRQAFTAALTRLEAELRQRPVRDASSFVGAMQPYYLAYQEEDNRELMERYGRLCSGAMRDWQRSAGLAMSPRASAASAAGRQSRVKIAFVSAYVASHPVHMAITRGWIRRLDRRRFALEVFHLGTKSDAETAAVRGDAVHFVEGARGIEEWARAILERSPDILIYPELGMDQMALQLASMRLAPVQLTAWGHPMTSGLPTIDYFLSADAFEPADGEQHYSERLVRLPNLGCYYEPPDAAPGAQPVDSAASAAPVFVCAGTPFKYAPQHDVLLVEIARRLGRCQFHFFSYADGALSRRLLQRLCAAFSAAGLDGASHLVLRPWARPAEFRALLRSADVLLDTVGFSGFNTVMQALACGLPVLTCRGRFMRGRLGAGVLERLSMPELVAPTSQAFVERAVWLAEDHLARSKMRRTVRERLPHVYLDHSVIRSLEACLLELFARAAE